MAEFRRPPEWQQQADRHTMLIDPVLTVRPISRFDYTARRPVSAIDHALVFATVGGAYDAYMPPHRPSRTDAATRRYTSVYEVDMGSHPVQLELELPSDDDAFSFSATADLTWRVSDPIAYVAGGERDVPTRLTREIHQFARPVSRRFSIEDSREAEAEVQYAIESGVFADGIGLTVTCAVRLRLDDDAIAHRRRKRALRYEADMLDPEHEYRLRQAQQLHELEVLRQHQSQELMAQKIAFYQYHLQHGGVAQWAFHLAAHPEDTRMVINALKKDQLSAIESQLELIAGDTLEDYQKAESARSTLRVVKELNSRQEPPPQPPVPGRPAPPGGVPQPPYDPSQPYAASQPYDPSQPYGAAAQPYGGAPAPGGLPGAPYTPPGPPVSHQPYVPPAPATVPPGPYQAEPPAPPAPAAGSPYDQAPPPPAVAPTPVIPPAPSAYPPPSPQPPAPESPGAGPE
ncbi:PE-PGRS family protein [Streptomyces sp. S1D4-11]|nr:PE-PGRS family protein [Streptomyces sp. S1D4-11]QIY97670.1 PE-PGRS family protein [Streptomyces sp. S1D4-11]